ncbi:MAG TPA: hypothetical protein VIM16_07275 [Mucilaginibacter sp.]
MKIYLGKASKNGLSLPLALANGMQTEVLAALAKFKFPGCE